jgi:hypothetical protein
VTAIIQPCRLSDRTVREHFDDTLATPVRLTRLAPFLPREDAFALDDVAGGSGTVQLWGVVPGRANTPRFGDLNVGDPVLYRRQCRPPPCHGRPRVPCVDDRAC